MICCSQIQWAVIQTDRQAGKQIDRQEANLYSSKSNVHLCTVDIVIELSSSLEDLEFWYCISDLDLCILN